MVNRLSPAFAALLLTLSASALAEPLNYNQVQLSADARREVNNDTLNAVLFSEESHSSPARLAALLNERIASALNVAKAASQVKTSSGQLSSWPLYDTNNRITGWRGRAEIRLESRDIARASQLIGQLQGSLQISQIGFSVSDEARRNTEAELIPQAINAFRDKALLISRALGSRDYKLVDMRVEHNGAPGVQLFRAPRSNKLAMAAEASPAPGFAPGASEISVQVNGTVQTQP